MTRAWMLGWATMAMAALLVCGCASRTEVIVAVDSDIASLDQITITVTGPTGTMQGSNATIGAGQPPLPRTLGLTWSSGPLGTFTAVATGLTGGVTILTRTATFSFVQGETRVLHLDLLDRCVATPCATGQTCGETLCRPEHLGPGELAPYTGAIAHSPDTGGPGMDANTPDTGGPAVDAGMADANMPDLGMPDDAFVSPDLGTAQDAACVANLQTDPANCGMCGHVCMLSNTATHTCTGGRCRIATCVTGFADCDMLDATGCEINTTNNPNHCGTCGNGCGGAMVCCNSMCAATCP